MIAHPPPRRHARPEPPTTPLHVPHAPWVLTGWGVAAVGIGLGLVILAVSLLLAPIAAVLA